MSTVEFSVFACVCFVCLNVAVSKSVSETLEACFRLAEGPLGSVGGIPLRRDDTTVVRSPLTALVVVLC